MLVVLARPCRKLSSTRLAQTEGSAPAHLLPLLAMYVFLLPFRSSHPRLYSFSYGKPSSSSPFPPPKKGLGGGSNAQLLRLGASGRAREPRHLASRSAASCRRFELRPDFGSGAATPFGTRSSSRGGCPIVRSPHWSRASSFSATRSDYSVAAPCGWTVWNPSVLPTRVVAGPKSRRRPPSRARICSASCTRIAASSSYASGPTLALALTLTFAPSESRQSSCSDRTRFNSRRPACF